MQNGITRRGLAKWRILQARLRSNGYIWLHHKINHKEVYDHLVAFTLWLIEINKNNIKVVSDRPKHDWATIQFKPCRHFCESLFNLLSTLNRLDLLSILFSFLVELTL